MANAIFDTTAPRLFIYKGVKYASIENAFYATCLTDGSAKLRSMRIDPKSLYGQFAKSLFNIARDWGNYFYDDLKDILREYSKDPEVKAALLAASDDDLAIVNNRHDRVLKSCNCSRCRGRGMNLAGKALMEIRDELLEAGYAR